MEAAAKCICWEKRKGKSNIVKVLFLLMNMSGIVNWSQIQLNILPGNIIAIL